MKSSESVSRKYPVPNEVEVRKKWATVAVGLGDKHHMCVYMRKGETEKELVARVENSLWESPAKIKGVYETPWGKTMRDPERIPEILDKLKEVWEKYPDLRLGQLIDNVVGRSPHPLFYIEDKDLVERVKKFYDSARVA